MTGFVIAAFAVAAAVILVWLALKAVDGSAAACAGLVVFAVFVLGVIINAAIKASEKGPCHQYETRLMYNAATKTMMPYRVCVSRGEWIEETADGNQ